MVICFQIIFLVIRVFLTRSKLWGWRLKVVEDFRIDQKFPRISKMRSIIKDNQLGFFIKREMTVPSQEYRLKVFHLFGATSRFSFFAAIFNAFRLFA